MKAPTSIIMVPRIDLVLWKKEQKICPAFPGLSLFSNSTTDDDDVST
jgi:hypothetical protein